MEERRHIIDSHRQIILALRDIEKKIEACLAANDPHWRQLEAERNTFRKQIEPLIEAYGRWIPNVELSQCPYCQQSFKPPFDSEDLNGFWWMDRTQRRYRAAHVCEHFCLLSGAVNLNGLPPNGGLFECRPGPDKPFVFPRLLAMPAMSAVISEIPMRCGYLAFPIVYFSKDAIPSKDLTQSWARKEYTIQLPDGRSGWNIREEKQDFDLLSWILTQKVLIYREGEFKPLEEGDPILKIQGVGRNQTISNNILHFENIATN